MRKSNSSSGTWAEIYGSLGDVTKGEPGKSAYEIAVEHGFEGTEEEWLSYVQANADRAVSAENAAVEAKEAAQYASDEAQGFSESASTSAGVAHTEAEFAAEAAAMAEAAAASARESRDGAAMSAADAADSATAAATSATEAASQALLATGRADEARQSQIDAHVSEVHIEEMYVNIIRAPVVVEEQTRQAIASAQAAAQSATAAAGSATSSAGSAESSATAATAAEAAAVRAENAMQTVIGSLDDYYDKEQVDSIVGAEASARSGQVQALQTAVADRYTKAEVNNIVAGVPHLMREVVSVLPTTDIDEHTIYMIQDGFVSGNAYAEYMYINGSWEVIGTTETELADYEKKSDIAPYKAKLDNIEAGAQVNKVTGIKGDSENTYRIGNVNITKDDIGLGNVDNTADRNKHVLKAKRLHNIDTETTYAVGDVVFDGALSPHMCYVCVTGSAGA